LPGLLGDRHRGGKDITGTERDATALVVQRNNPAKHPRLRDNAGYRSLQMCNRALPLPYFLLETPAKSFVSFFDAYFLFSYFYIL